MTKASWGRPGPTGGQSGSGEGRSFQEESPRGRRCSNPTSRYQPGLQLGPCPCSPAAPARLSLSGAMGVPDPRRFLKLFPCLRLPGPWENLGGRAGGGKGREGRSQPVAQAWHPAAPSPPAPAHTAPPPSAPGRPWGSCCTRTPSGTSSGKTSGTTTWCSIVSVHVAGLG